MCSCGCNTCETKIRGPLLTESRVKKLVSENLQYHINRDIPLMESEFRIGSEAHLSLIKEARKLYSRGVLDLCEEDEGIMDTHLGEFDLYEDTLVPLDLPMLNESYNFDESLYGSKYGYTDSELRGYDEVAQSEFGMDYDQLGSGEKEWVRDEIDNMSINEAKKKKEKKDPPIGKPKRGGPKAYYVYVRDPKTKRIKKVTFGSGGLRAKIRNPKARKAFAARHRCSTAKDRTTARYWSCRLPRYAKQLGLGANMNTFW
jgi:hypothetical protein|tara:strand:- start:544 stop:1317 length:774 start_codon:yes stop_codon:yes gene_type:complete